MLSDAELQQMLADAQRIEALRGKATPGPWDYELTDVGDDEFVYVPSEVTNKSGRKIVSFEGGLVPFDSEWTKESIEANADFIAATRTDPSAANVLKLLEEVDHLRNRLRLYIDHPNGDPVYFDPSCITEDVLPSRRNAAAEDVIFACHVHGVPVPEHLRPYEKVGE